MADIEREIGWDEEISNDGEEFVVLPAGDYDFEVVGFERGRHEGSAKLPPCNKAVLHLKLTGEAGSTTIKHNLFLHTKTEGMISQFLIGIGQKKHGEPTRPNWNAMVGARGRAKVAVRSWKGDDGTDHQRNDVKKFYEPEERESKAAEAAVSFTPGAF